MDAWHVAATVVEYGSIAMLLHKQGVLRLRCRNPLAVQRLCLRLKRRLSTCPTCRDHEVARDNATPRRSCLVKVCYSLLLIGTLGSIAMAAIGLLSGFIQLKLPTGDWGLGALKNLLVGFVMPGFIEEVVFRGLLVRDAAEHEAVEETGCDQVSRSVSLPRVDLAEAHEGNKEKKQVPVSSTEESRHADIEVALEMPGRHGSSVESNESSESSPVEPSHSSHRPPLSEQVAVILIFVVYHLDIIHLPSVFRDVRFLLMAAILGICCQEALIISGSLWPGIIMHWLWVWAWITFD